MSAIQSSANIYLISKRTKNPTTFDIYNIHRRQYLTKMTIIKTFDSIKEYNRENKI